MKIQIFLLLSLVIMQSLAIDSTLDAINPNCEAKKNATQKIPNCQSELDARIKYCSRLDTNEPYYFRIYYQCIYMDKNISHECAEKYCSSVADLEQFCVNCSDFTYNYTLKWKNASQIKPHKHQLTCDINTISGCAKAVNEIEDYCQAMIGTLDPKYYNDFYNCVQSQKQIKAIANCSQCYCEGKQLYAFGVNCNSSVTYPVVNTSKLSPAQKFKNITSCDITCIPCCIEAVSAAEPQCQQSVPQSENQYYEKFYNCMKTNKDVAAVEGCAKCYCNGILKGEKDLCEADNIFTYMIKNMKNKIQ